MAERAEDVDFGMICGELLQVARALEARPDAELRRSGRQVRAATMRLHAPAEALALPPSQLTEAQQWEAMGMAVGQLLASCREAVRVVDRAALPALERVAAHGELVAFAMRQLAHGQDSAAWRANPRS